MNLFVNNRLNIRQIKPIKDKLPNMNILVTGAAGFIGFNTCLYLLRKYPDAQITALDNFITGDPKNFDILKQYQNVFCIEKDVCMIKDIPQYDAIIHMAALGSVPRSIEQPIESHTHNGLAFISLAMAAFKARVPKIIYASSSSVYGDNQDAIKSENNLGKTLSPYAASKRFIECYANAMQSLCSHNAAFIGLRFFNVFGPYQRVNGHYAAVIPKWIDSFTYGNDVSINGLDVSRDFTYVANVLYAIDLILKQKEIENLKGQIMNIACGESISLEKLCANLNELISPRNFGPKSKVFVNSQRPGDIKHSLADISLAKNLIGYNPVINFDEGLALTVNHYSKQFDLTL